MIRLLIADDHPSGPRRSPADRPGCPRARGGRRSRQWPGAARAASPGAGRHRVAGRDHAGTPVPGGAPTASSGAPDGGRPGAQRPSGGPIRGAGPPRRRLRLSHQGPLTRGADRGDPPGLPGKQVRESRRWRSASPRTWRPGSRDIRHELLSDREYEVLCLLGSGRTVKEIAQLAGSSAPRPSAPTAPGCWRRWAPRATPTWFATPRCTDSSPRRRVAAVSRRPTALSRKSHRCCLRPPITAGGRVSYHWLMNSATQIQDVRTPDRGGCHDSRALPFPCYACWSGLACSPAATELSPTDAVERELQCRRTERVRLQRKCQRISHRCGPPDRRRLLRPERPPRMSSRRERPWWCPAAASTAPTAVAQGPLTGCQKGEGVRWDTAQLLGVHHLQVHRRRCAEGRHHEPPHGGPAGRLLPGRRWQRRVVHRPDDRIRRRSRARDPGDSDPLGPGRGLRLGQRALQRELVEAGNIHRVRI